MTIRVSDGSTTSRRNASTASFSCGVRPNVATACLLDRDRLKGLCGIWTPDANPVRTGAPEKHHVGLPTPEAGANRAPHPLAPPGRQPPELAYRRGRAQTCQDLGARKSVE